MRSPVIRLAALTGVVSFCWVPVKWYSDAPAAPHAASVRPEQSNVVGPAWANSYREPIFEQA